MLENNDYQRKMMAYVENYCLENEVECYNFNNNEIFPNDFFRDPNHLNLRGSEKLSAMMKNVLDQVGQPTLTGWISYGNEN
jgi:hypothetical protein